jgi:hypothetical protein
MSWLIFYALAGLAGTPLLATLGRCLTLASRLRAFVVGAATSLGENPILLNLAVKLLKGKLKGVAGVNFDLTHRPYQRDLRSLDRPEL